jgi:hypothetical protein
LSAKGDPVAIAMCARRLTRSVECREAGTYNSW